MPVETLAQLNTRITRDVADNTDGNITAALMRQILQNLNESVGLTSGSINGAVITLTARDGTTTTLTIPLPATATEAESEAGTETGVRLFSPARIADAIATLSPKADWTETDVNDPSFIQNKPVIPAAQVQTDWDATSGLGVLLNKPTIPPATPNNRLIPDGGATGQVLKKDTATDYDVSWQNDATASGGGALPDQAGHANQFLRTDGAAADWAAVPEQVQTDWNATTGLAVLLNKPTIPAAQVQTDWDATTGLGVLLNKPTIPTLPAAATQAEAEAGTETALRQFSPQRVAEAIAALAPTGSGGVAGVTLTAHTWTGDTTLNIATNDTWTDWTDLQSFTLSAGIHLLNIELFEDRSAGVVAWVGFQFRMRHNNADVWAEPEARRRNARGASDIGQIESSLSIPVSGSGTFTLQVRARTDNRNNFPTAVWQAADQLSHILTFTTASSGGGTTPLTHQRYFFWQSAATTPTPAQLQGGAGSTTDDTTLNTATGTGFLHFWIWSAEQLTVIRSSDALNPNDNLLDTFTASRLTIGATNGHLYTRQLRASAIGSAGNPITWTAR